MAINKIKFLYKGKIGLDNDVGIYNFKSDIGYEIDIIRVYILVIEKEVIY